MGVILLPFLYGCSYEPSEVDVEGKWISPTGGEFQLNHNGTFNIKNVPGDFILEDFDEHEKLLAGESGKWKIEKWQGIWVVDLSFAHSDRLKKGYATRILIGGSGILKNKPPWNLYYWKGEEGEEKYTFKKNSDNLAE